MHHQDKNIDSYYTTVYLKKLFIFYKKQAKYKIKNKKIKIKYQLNKFNFFN